jgi:excisionase family DNA binding protein
MTIPVDPVDVEKLPARPTIKQSANAFQVSDKTMRRWIRDRRVKAYRVGPRLVRVDKESLLKLARGPL